MTALPPDLTTLRPRELRQLLTAAKKYFNRNVFIDYAEIQRQRATIAALEAAIATRRKTK